jgi:hypothetical protein
MRHLIATLCATLVWLLSQPSIAQDEGLAAPIEKAPYHLPFQERICDGVENQFATSPEHGLSHSHDGRRVGEHRGGRNGEPTAWLETNPTRSKRGQAKFHRLFEAGAANP